MRHAVMREHMLRLHVLAVGGEMTPPTRTDRTASQWVARRRRLSEKDAKKKEEKARAAFPPRKTKFFRQKCPSTHRPI
jgi:hypothetical protein